MADNRVYFITNRNLVAGRSAKRGTFGPGFHKDGPSFFRTGSVEAVRQGKGFRKYKIAKPDIAGETRPRGPSERGAKRGSDQVFAEIRDRMRDEKRDLIVFLHGFATDFDGGVRGAAQIRDRYRVSGDGGTAAEPLTLAVSWPADGKMRPGWQYASDRQDARLSGVAIARAMMRLLDFLTDQSDHDSAVAARAEAAASDKEASRIRDGILRCDQRIHLVAHSMGNWALRHAVQAMRQEMAAGNQLPRLFDTIFLMAADEDENALSRDDKLADLPRLGKAIHVYHAWDDGALVISDVTKGNPDRLGHGGPETFSGLSARITAVDCHKVSNTGKVADVCHQYFRFREEVIDDVNQVLSGVPGNEIDGRDVIEPGRRYRIRER